MGSSYLVVTSAFLIVINLIALILFELKKPKPEEILPIVVICCGASLGRLVFAVIPQVQPVTVLVIITGSVFGCRKGYITGALCALVSNLFMGQGPWTIFQMTAWGTVGLLAGLLAKPLQQSSENTQKIVFTVYGFFSAFLFSIITDFLTIAYIGNAVTFKQILAVYIAGIAFNVGHAIFNGILMAFIYVPIRRKLLRVNRM